MLPRDGVLGPLTSVLSADCCGYPDFPELGWCAKGWVRRPPPRPPGSFAPSQPADPIAPMKQAIAMSDDLLLPFMGATIVTRFPLLPEVGAQ